MTDREPSDRETSPSFFPLEIWPGEPYPLGASYDGAGTNFSIFSEVAERVEVCFFDNGGEERRINLPETTGFIWHGYVPGVEPGQRYGFRVHGPWDPGRGHRCNPHKLLLDPYAKAADGHLAFNPAVYGYDFDNDRRRNDRDSAPYVPRSVVANPFFDWGDDRPPRTPWHETVIYEAHVKGLTATHPDVPKAQRGTYAALAHPAVIEHLTSLGVTAVELMPIHFFIHDHALQERGLKNYWGYNSISFLAPHNGYAYTRKLGAEVQEVKHAIRSLHAAGIEVILDVVYNHTAEGNHLGPTLCFRGIDNRAYYRLEANEMSLYRDYTGCGNTLNMQNPHVLQLIMDSLRYWIVEMHVDGFRFDLASALARELHDVNRLSTFFHIIQQDPIISQVKLIAEPWDLGDGGYQVGNFPPLWSEWNGRYRDTVRDFWRGEERKLAELASRLTGSSDLYECTGRRPYASINFVTCHDGFTLRDLVSYNQKHNLANGEEGRDGENHNRSFNCGAEGETTDDEVLERRRRMQRNFLATLFFSQGVPMLLAGDEFGRTQHGNNNAYCQDNAISWIDWEGVDNEMWVFTKNLLAFQHDHPVLRRRGWFQGTSARGTDLTDIGWFKPDGEQMSPEDWEMAYARTIGIFLNGDGITARDRHGRPVRDDSLFIILNAHVGSLPFVLPAGINHGGYREVLDTSLEPAWIDDANALIHHSGDILAVAGQSVRVLARPMPRRLR